VATVLDASRQNGHASLIGRALIHAPKGKPVRAALGKAWRAVRPVALSVAALGCLVAAAFTWAMPAGLVAAGLALAVLEWRIKE
jgi:hypothetical protein